MKNITKTILFLTFVFVSNYSLAFSENTHLKAPAFNVTTIDGQHISPEISFGKKPIYLVFWATWCPTCLKEIPNLRAINDKYGNEIDFVAINVDRTNFWYNLTTSESKNPVRAYLKKHGIDYNIALDDDKKLSNAFNVKGTPTQVLIDKHGNVQQYFHKTPTDINASIEKLIAE